MNDHIEIHKDGQIDTKYYLGFFLKSNPFGDAGPPDTKYLY